MRQLVVSAVLAVAVTAVDPVSASVIVGGRTFEDNSFADAVTLPAVNYLLWTGSGNTQITTNQSIASTALTDNPALASAASATFAACDPASVAASSCGNVIFSFTNNVIVNGSGPDFTIFDVNVPNDVRVSILGVTVTVLSVAAGTTARPPNLGGGTWGLNAADFDLSDFGVASGASVSSLSFDWGFESAGTRAGVSLVGALNSRSVPEPSSLALLGVAALAAVGLFRRRLRCIAE